MKRFEAMLLGGTEAARWCLRAKMNMQVRLGDAGCHCMMGMQTSARKKSAVYQRDDHEAWPPDDQYPAVPPRLHLLNTRNDGAVPFVRAFHMFLFPICFHCRTPTAPAATPSSTA